MSVDNAYGCLFCITGREEYVARHIREIHPNVQTLVAYREKHKSVNGQLSKERDILLPSYVFFAADAAFNPFDAFRMDAVIRVLTAGDHEWQLQGADRDFAQWLFARDGLLEMSKGYHENDRIRIVSGPLKDMEGCVRKIDRHSRRGQVELEFAGHTMKVWLSFELIAAELVK